MSDMPTRRIIPGIYPFCSLLLCGEQRVSSHSHYLCFKLLCMHSQSKQAIVVLLNGCTSGSQGSPGYERNVLLFQQASVMLLCWEPWPSVRQPPEANVRALRSYRLTITAGTQSLNRDATSACPNLRRSPLFPFLFVPKLQHIHRFLHLDGNQCCPPPAQGWIQCLQLALANGKDGQFCGLIWSTRALNGFILSC